MVFTCCVPGCTEKSVNIKDHKVSTFSFHSFPKCEKLKKQWLDAIGIKTEELKKNSKVCSKHFLRSDFSLAKGIRKFKQKGTVPSVFTNVNIKDKEHPEEMQVDHNLSFECSHYIYNMDVGQMCDVTTNTESSTPIDSDMEIGQLYDVEASTSNDNAKVINNECEGSIYKITNVMEEHMYGKMAEVCEILKSKKQITYLQSKLLTLEETNQERYSRFSINQFKSNDNTFLYYTGLPSYKIFRILLEFLLPTGDIAYINTKTRKTKRRKHKLSIENQLFICLIKLRKNIDYEMLGDMFGVSSSTIGTIFLTWVNLLYVKLGCLDVWPHRDILVENAPAEFREQYANVIGSIDCTEYFIQKPSSMVRQSQCYSNYKSTTTLKALIMVDPNGSIMFNSTLMTGSVSNKQIVVDSGWLATVKRKLEQKKLFPGDIIMADKGFNVEALFKDIPININIPTFRISGFEFSPEQVQISRNIAKERIHVERAIGRLKKYKILSNIIPISLLGSINQIHSVCCMLTNFTYLLR